MTSLTDLEQKVLSHVEYGEDLRPVRDWLTLLAVTAILFVISVLWNGWLYVRISSGEGLGNSSAPSTTVDTNALDAAQAVFDKRATEAANYRGAYHFVDPSK
jgi:hypothetical protein